MTRSEEDGSPLRKKYRPQRTKGFAALREGNEARIPLDRMSVDKRLAYGLSLMSLGQDGVYDEQYD